MSHEQGAGRFAHSSLLIAHRSLSKTFESITPTHALANAMHKRHSLSKTCALFSVPPKAAPHKAFDAPQQASKQTWNGIRLHAGTKSPIPGLWYSEVAMLRQSVVRWFRMALLGAVVSLAFGTMASAQSWGYGDDRSYDRHEDARDRGFHRGYDDGSRKGQYDADRGHRFNFKNDDWEDSRGFEHWMGDKHEYKRAYRNGYERGYREAFNNYRHRDRDDDRWRDRDNWR